MESSERFKVTFYKEVKSEPKNKYAEYAYLFKNSDDFGTWKKENTYYKEKKKDAKRKNL